MDKTTIDQSNEEGQTAKPSVASSTVLNILKRFRSRRAETGDQEPSFDDRLGAASGPLAERISEISTLIEAGRSKGPANSQSASADTDRKSENAADDNQKTTEEPTETPPDRNAGTRPKVRVRSMGFHNPVFPAKPLEDLKDPEFEDSTKPPTLKIHDAPEGVMENSGAPEKQVTAPKKKTAEPLDLKVFAEQVRGKLDVPENVMPAADETGSENTGTEAEAFRQQFFARISKASKASVFEPFSGAEEARLRNLPKAAMNLEARDITASSALRSWRNFQSPEGGERQGEEAERFNAPLRIVETEAPPPPVGPAPLPETPQAGENTEPDTPDSETGQDFLQSGYVPFEPECDSEDIIQEYESPAENRQEPAPGQVAEQPPEPKAGPMEDAELEILADIEPASSTVSADPQNSEHPVPEDTVQAKPDNVFAALNIDEDDLLIKVYDVIQAELQAAWGESITLNIRKIVRQELRAAIEKTRSDS